MKLNSLLIGFFLTSYFRWNYYFVPIWRFSNLDCSGFFYITKLLHCLPFQFLVLVYLAYMIFFFNFWYSQLISIPFKYAIPWHLELLESLSIFIQFKFGFLLNSKFPGFTFLKYFLDFFQIPMFLNFNIFDFFRIHLKVVLIPKITFLKK